jgi:hypothetical protein
MNVVSSQPDRPPLHIVFTMDCLPAGLRHAPEGPRDWIQSGRSIEGFCDLLRSAGFPATLFLTPQTVAEHGPLLDDLRDLGAELALLLHPPTLPSGRRGRYLGHYARAGQARIVELASSAFEEILGEQPRTVRSAMFSASDDTYPLLFELGFRQGSLSSPGRKIGRHVAHWDGAETDAHYVSRDSRLRKGQIPFLELPVTTDSTVRKGGVAPDLTIENGTVDAFHRPLIEGQLERFERQNVSFRSLCFLTYNRHAYHQPTDRVKIALENLLDYLLSLENRYALCPTTLAGAHARFRRLSPAEVQC